MNGVLDRIELEIEKSLTGIFDRWEDLPDPESDAEWTRTIKNTIGRIGKDQGYEIYAAESNFSDNGEWLYDMTWLKMSGARVLGVPLVLECEWTPSGTLEDFQKLLVARAERRVMVHWAPDEQAARRTIRDLVAQVEEFELSQPGDQYLFACYLGDSDRFLFERHSARRQAHRIGRGVGSL